MAVTHTIEASIRLLVILLCLNHRRLTTGEVAKIDAIIEQVIAMGGCGQVSHISDLLSEMKISVLIVSQLGIEEESKVQLIQSQHTPFP